MNKIEKQKGMLVGLGIIAFVMAILTLVFGIILIVHGAGALGEAGGIVKLLFGILLVILSFPLGLFGAKCIWVALALNAVKGSIKEGNIAKEGGTVNMKKCDKCGTERKDGETACSNCGKPFEN